MRKFIGTKIISATPMALIAAQELLNRDVGYQGLTDKEGDCPGYLVEYGQQDNSPVYRTWSPDDVFQKAYNSFISSQLTTVKNPTTRQNTPQNG